MYPRAPGPGGPLPDFGGPPFPQDAGGPYGGGLMAAAPPGFAPPPTQDSRLAFASSAASSPHVGQAAAAAASQRPSDEALRASIAEKFAGAYEAQLGYLSRVSAVEQQQLQRDIDGLRNAAYFAQRSAAEHRARADAARQALGQGHLNIVAMREGLRVAQHESAVESAALQASQEAASREEAALASLQARVREECDEMSAQCRAAQRRRRHEEQRSAELAQQLAQVRASCHAEARAAQEEQRQAQAAAAARDEALQGLRSHEDLAVQTLKDAVGRLEADFARERVEFVERDRRATAQVRELERQLDDRRRLGAPASPTLGGVWLTS